MANISLDNAKRYIDSFPIAYYAGKPIKMDVRPHLSMSKANIVTESIEISLSQINDGLKLVPDNVRVDEKLLRPLCYHEVSHVIATPRKIDYSLINDVNRDIIHNRLEQKTLPTEFNSWYWMPVSQVINIFEDERIERKFDNLYADCDFYDNILRICGYTGQKTPLGAIDIFYAVVRFHERTECIGIDYEKLYLKSRKILLKHIGLSAFSPRDKVSEYLYDVFDLYLDCEKAMYDYINAVNQMLDRMSDEELKSLLKMFDEGGVEKVKTLRSSNNINRKLSERMKRLLDDHEKAKAEKERQQAQAQDAEDDEDDDVEESSDQQSKADSKQVQQTPDDFEDETDEDPSDEGDSDGDAFSPDGGQSDSSSDKAGHGEGDTKKVEVTQKDEESLDKEINDVERQIEKQGTNVEQTRKMFDETIFNASDDDVTNVVMKKMFKQQVADAQAAATHKYSGKLDVRSIGRDDWKIFLRRSSKGESKLGKKLHLILILDQSGSYLENDEPTNKVIKALVELERIDQDFSLDIVKFNTGWHVCKRDERFSDSNGGTTLSQEMFEEVEKMKRPDMLNYIVMLNDGEADVCGDDFNNVFKRVMNSKNVAIIVDEWFSSFYKKKLKKPKIIATTRYATELSNNVCEILNEMIV